MRKLDLEYYEDSNTNLCEKLFIFSQPKRLFFFKYLILLKLHCFRLDELKKRMIFL